MTKPSSKAGIEQAQAALLDDPNFRQLQTLIELPHTFNIFEAVGVTRQELRHSTFLATLLDPRYPHGLGDRFVRALLTDAFPAGLPGLASSVADLRLDPLHVRREWENIDILLEAPADKLVVVIENKIWSGEHSNQLERYLSTMERHYQGWTIVPLFLTPDGTQPSDARYHLLDYNVVCRIIERMVATAGSALNAAVRMTLDHYSQMLRRHIVFDADSEAARLARRLYHDHESLINALIKQREQRQQMIRRTIEGLVRNADNRLRLDQSHVSESYWWFTRFAPPAWYESQPLLVSNWTRSRLVMMFQCIHTPEEIKINLAVGPDTTGGPMRNTLYALAQRHGWPFAEHGGPHEKFFAIYERSVLDPETAFFTDYTDAQIKQAIEAAWQQFVTVDLLAIERIIAHSILGQ